MLSRVSIGVIHRKELLRNMFSGKNDYKANCIPCAMFSDEHKRMIRVQVVKHFNDVTLTKPEYY